MVKHILFDLDGTIIESAPGIMNATLYAMEKMGEAPPPKEKMRLMVGPPLEAGFRDVCGLSPQRAKEGVPIFREYYQRKGIFEIEPYAGIFKVLEQLNNDGFRVYLATSKPGPFAKRVLDHLQITGYFADVEGSSLEFEGPPKSEIIAKLMETHGFTADEAVMVGDRHHDVTAALANGMDTVGVLYGYGTKEELTDAGSRYLVDDTAQLYALLLSLGGK